MSRVNGVQPVSKVLVSCLIQDPSVLSNETAAINFIQPIVASHPAGFADGPACARVAVVDIGPTGKVKRGAVLDPVARIYRGVGGYHVRYPLPPKGSKPPWTKGSGTTSIDVLSSAGYKDPFLAVSAFGAVVRTLAFVENIALGRSVKWAFHGDQLLVVPRAGELDNAFYHRESHALYFYFFSPVSKTGRTVYSALSQDIVTHEATHAIIDGIAPDLFDACSPESLAIHESVADFTAVLLSFRNRELRPARFRELAAAKCEISKPSRFSRIAEEFGYWRSGSPALRDACNRKTLNPSARSAGRRVDSVDPHSLSEVLTGALFGVFTRTFAAAGSGGRTDILRRYGNRVPLWYVQVYTINRLASLVFKGLEWLPPGENSFADYAHAMVAADEFYWPGLGAQRKWLMQECRVRHMLDSITRIVKARSFGSCDRDLLIRSAAARRIYIDSRRALLGMPDGVHFKVRCSLLRRSELRPSALWGELRPGTMSRSETADLSFTTRTRPNADLKAMLLIKVAWWMTEPNELGREFGSQRRLKVGATLAVDDCGKVCAFLGGAQQSMQRYRRTQFLRTLAACGALVPPGKALGPDGEPLQSCVISRLRGNTLCLSSVFRSLHLADTMI